MIGEEAADVGLRVGGEDAESKAGGGELLKGFPGAGEWSDVVDLFLQFGGPASRHGSDFFEGEVQEAHEFERSHGAQGGQFGAVDGPAAPLGGEFLEDAEAGFEGVCEGAVEVEKDQFQIPGCAGRRCAVSQETFERVGDAFERHTAIFAVRLSANAAGRGGIRWGIANVSAGRRRVRARGFGPLTNRRVSMSWS